METQGYADAVSDLRELALSDAIEAAKRAAGIIDRIAGVLAVEGDYKGAAHLQAAATAIREGAEMAERART